MNLVLRSRTWITKVAGGLAVSAFLSLPAYDQLMLAHEGHHSGGGCSVKSGEFPVSISVYEVPEGGIPPMHSFCESVPKTGKINMTIELPQEAREFPLAVRLVKGGSGHEGHGGAKSNNASEKKPDQPSAHENHDEHAGHQMEDKSGIVYMPAELHSSGIIVMAANIQEKGHYTVQLERKDDAGKTKTVVSIPLSVGLEGGHGSHGGGLGMMEIILALVVVGGGAGYYFFVHRKKTTQASA